MENIRKLLGIIVVTVVALTGFTSCDDDTPDEFIGTWKAYNIVYQAYDASGSLIWEDTPTSGVTWYFYSDGHIEIIAAPIEVETDGDEVTVAISSNLTMTSQSWSSSGSTLNIGDKTMTINSMSTTLLSVEGTYTEEDVTIYTYYDFYKAG